MVRPAFQAGLAAGSVAAALVVVMFSLWDVFRLVWPLVYVPLFATGVIAVRRAGDAVRSPGAAAMTGALAGLVAATLFTAITVSVTAAAGSQGGPRPGGFWALVPVLLDSPFFVPPSVLFFPVPELPFSWPYQLVTPAGVRISRIPITLALFLPVGAVLSAAQAWAYYGVTRRIDLAGRAIGALARSRTSFRRKLAAGFVVLAVAVFSVGWLGFASVEEMHFKVHVARVRHHWLDHGLRIQSNLRAYGDRLERLMVARDEASLGETAALGGRIAAELAHLRTIPPPQHPPTALGAVGGPTLTDEAQRRLPVVREADSRFRELSAAAGRAIELARAGDGAALAATASGLAGLRRAVETPVAELVRDLNADQVGWGADADDASHGQQLAAMLLVLIATALALPLGYVFSQIVVRPVRLVAEGLQRIGAGDFSAQVRVENMDELGELADHVNRMGRELERLYGELRALNEGLQQRVQDAVHEIERSRMLRRYLPHQVADAVIASGDESLLRTHRREITAVFADLRGFTAFAETAEPEVVMRVIGEYHEAMGELISRFSATLEHYAGDGVMVYFNDPLAQEDHPERAVRMALAMRDRVGELAKGWRRFGFELDFGVGIAVGYATLGTVGFVGRRDYSAIGTVMNLASRLSDEARGGQVLASQRVYALVEPIVGAEPLGELTLKGFLKPVPAYNILTLRESPTAVM